MRNSPGFMDGSIVCFGEIYQRPVNSRLYSGWDDRKPIIPDVVLGMDGDGFRRIGERLIASSGGLCSKVSAGNPFFLHSSTNTYGQWHRNTLKFVWCTWRILHRTFLYDTGTFLKNPPIKCSYFLDQLRRNNFSRNIISLLKFIYIVEYWSNIKQTKQTN